MKAYTDIEQSKKLAEILPIGIEDKWVIMNHEKPLKEMHNRLNTMLEFDEGIDVDSVDELKEKYDNFVKENFKNNEEV